MGVTGVPSAPRVQAVSQPGSAHDEEADAAEGEREGVGIHVGGILQALAAV